MTIIVPVDFSNTSQNAALYALNMLKGNYSATLLLYHVYYRSEDFNSAMLTLEVMKQKLSKLGDTKITIRTDYSLDFKEALLRLARHESATAIVMGIHERSKMEQAFISSETLKLAGKTICPVIIVPPDVVFKEIKSTVLVCDMKHLESGIPFLPIKNVLSIFKTSLYLVYISEAGYISLTESQIDKCKQLENEFLEFRPESYFVINNQFQDTVFTFIKEHEIDLVIFISKQPSFFEKLYTTNALKQLAFGSSVPVLAAPA